MVATAASAATPITTGDARNASKRKPGSEAKGRCRQEHLMQLAAGVPGRPMPEMLGPLPKSAHPYARNNLWQLYAALAWGGKKLHFICLWNRKAGDGPGGTKHMYDTVVQPLGQVHVLDTTKLW